MAAVIAAYWVGRAAGFEAGQEHGYGQGKREGSREGSMRGYAVGFDRGRRGPGAEKREPAGRGIGVGVIALLAAAAAIFFLAGKSRRQVQVTNPQPVRTIVVPSAGQLAAPPPALTEPSDLEFTRTGPVDPRLVPVPANTSSKSRTIDAKPQLPQGAFKQPW